jgi:hypothetical protein
MLSQFRQSRANALPHPPPLSSVSNEGAKGALSLEKGNKKCSLSAADKNNYSSKYSYTQPYTDMFKKVNTNMNK